MTTPRTRRPAAKRSPDPAARQAAQATARSTKRPVTDDQLVEAILRTLRRHPNRTVDLSLLAEELGVEPYRVQLTVERLGRRRMVVVPFIEPATAGGATLTEKGLRWLIAREGGKPKDTPTAYQPAKKRVRAGDEAARLPRAQVYGVRR